MQHRRRVVVLTVGFADLMSDAEQIVTVDLRASTGGYELDLFREAPASGAWGEHAGLSTEPIFPDPEDVPDCGAKIPRR